MDASEVLLSLLLTLAAAKIIAELAERISVPAVLGEILAGALFGPSVLGLVQPNEFLTILGEIGVILLLLEVGMEMDLRDLLQVGRASLSVAVTGILLPIALGFGALTIAGYSPSSSFFLGAALTATSVGITARAFGDLRALATLNARIVIGAAVADDVLGLILLTVVARVAEGGSLNAQSILTIIGVALGFLILATAAGSLLVPRLLSVVHSRTRSPGMLLTCALVTTLVFAEFASLANLAPIVGAFVAGLSIGKSRHAERVANDLAPLGHLFIPVFFFLIGANADVGAFKEPKVIAIGAILSVVGLVSKLGAGWAARDPRADHLLIGIGMIPRGEVGLIFATIGLQTKVLDKDLYLALIVAVLITTLVTPPLLGARFRIVKARDNHASPPPDSAPDGGWISIEADEIVLQGRPPQELRLTIALEAAKLRPDAIPSEGLLDWLTTSSQDGSGPATESEVQQVLELLRSGDSQSWRLLDSVDALEPTLSVLGKALRRRVRASGGLDPTRNLILPTVQGLKEYFDPACTDRLARQQLVLCERPDLLLLGALLQDLMEYVDEDDRPGLLDSILPIDADAEQLISLTQNSFTMRAAARHHSGIELRNAAAIASEVGSVQQARMTYLLAVVGGELGTLQRNRLDTLLHQVVTLLSHDGGVGSDQSPGLLGSGRAAALAAARGPKALHRLSRLAEEDTVVVDPVRLGTALSLLDAGVPPVGYTRIRLTKQEDAHCWELDVAARDRSGLLARLTAGIRAAGFEISSAEALTWKDHATLDLFEIRGETAPDEAILQHVLEQRLRAPLASQPCPDAVVEFDNDAHPTRCIATVRGPDRPGMAADIAAAFAQHGCAIHHAVLSSQNGGVVDTFTLSTASGGKIPTETQNRIAESLQAGIEPENSRVARIFRKSPIAT